MSIRVEKLSKCKYLIKTTNQVIETYSGIHRNTTGEGWITGPAKGRKQKSFADVHYLDDPLESLKAAEEYVKQTRTNLVEKDTNINKTTLPDGTELPLGISLTTFTINKSVYEHFIILMNGLYAGCVYIGNINTITLEDYHRKLVIAKRKLNKVKQG